MKKIIPVLLLFVTVQIFGQRDFNKPGEPSFPKLIYTQTLALSEDSVANIYYFFKLPYQNIVFLKNGYEYNAQVRIDIEVTDTNSNFIKREIKDWKIKTPSYEQTNLTNLFAEGFISIKLNNGAYNLLPIFTDLNSNREIKLKRERLNIKEVININPLVIDSKKINCNGKEYFRLTNFEGNIPFGIKDYNLIIPSADTSVRELSVTVLSVGDTIIQRKLSESFLYSLAFEECSGYIIINDKGKIQTRNFILDNFSHKLKEGPFTIIVDELDIKYVGVANWYNKPKSLSFPDISIHALEYIEDEVVIDSLLDIDSDKQYNALVKYWKRKDPTPETEYNELMNEYYSRVDYAQLNFSTLTGTKSVNTDRGKIYIMFGKPDKIERNSNSSGKVVETWIYNNPQRKFVFVDKQGVGEFSLESS